MYLKASTGIFLLLLFLDKQRYKHLFYCVVFIEEGSLDHSSYILFFFLNMSVSQSLYILFSCRYIHVLCILINIFFCIQNVFLKHCFSTFISLLSVVYSTYIEVQQKNILYFYNFFAGLLRASIFCYFFTYFLFVTYITHSLHIYVLSVILCNILLSLLYLYIHTWCCPALIKVYIYGDNNTE